VSIHRLRELAYWNTKEALGEGAADATRHLSDSICGDICRSRYGDGHLAPHEWIRTPNGKIIKTDGFGHDSDHTTIGVQSILWDIAAAIVEWKLREDPIAVLLQPIRQSGITFTEPALRFYCIAYAAFRVGQTHLSAESKTLDLADRERLRKASVGYREQLARIINR
jgi:hypothetical protein